MSEIGKSERATQKRLIALFCEELGYDFLGDWHDRASNNNIEVELLSRYLREKGGYSEAQINAALQRLTVEATNKNRNLIENNKVVYSLLRFGVPVKVEAGQVTETVHLIDWKAPEKNDFAIAEEVTLKRGGHERRPDLVLYVNGIAVGVIELKNSRSGVGNGIRQSLSNQKPEFNAWFFTTVQFVFAGNDSEGLRYGTVGTEEKYFLKWKEDESDNTRYKLDKYLIKMCQKARLIELMHDFILFDAGKKKVPRVHQYFGIKAAQKHVKEKRGGIIWHTQGSGKSIVMVLLGKWILENNPNARIAIITDRDELDKQIEGVFKDAGEQIVRSGSGHMLMRQLAEARPRILCSLVHKFGGRRGRSLSDREFEKYVAELQDSPSATMGEIFVFVDECHRTQGGRLHKLMKANMPNAVFIGFTGTPLLKQDRATSREIFGGYIHTYKFDEAVDDGVILDLMYEARDVNQTLSSPEKVDTWFKAKTRGLNSWQKNEIMKKWGTLKSVLSSKSRMDKIINDIVFDFSTKPRLSSERGNAILVASSIFEACKYFAMFQETVFKDKCAVVTSYDPQASDISLEEIGANTDTDKQFVYKTYMKLLAQVDSEPGRSRTETYEDASKARFIKEPNNMKLLIVVNKLLTGFDAPPCTYLYIDKHMQDHGLFQAICRTNRLDGEDKQAGYIVDYMDLFKKVENAIAVYTSELDQPDDEGTTEILLADRLERGRERLDGALETLILLCEPVEEPKGELEHIRYFCGNTEIRDDLEENEPRREMLYKATAEFVRSYANLADDMTAAGYNDEEVGRIKAKLNHFVKLRDTIRAAAGELLDMKPYEADMRHLIDRYIEADEPRKISPFDDIGLLDLIVKTGIAQAIAEKLSDIGDNRNAVAETIENNVRKKIVKEQMLDPMFYESMSGLLDEVIRDRKTKAIAYEEYLKRIAEIIKKVTEGKAADTPAQLDFPETRAIYNALRKIYSGSVADDEEENVLVEYALRVDRTVKKVKPDNWKGDQPKEMMIKGALYGILDNDEHVETIFRVISNRGEYS